MEPGTAAGRFDLRETRRRLLLVAADDDNLGARSRQTFSHRAAQFARTADDDGDLASERKQCIQKFSRGHVSLAHV